VPRVLHPEFGYLGTPNFGRRLTVFAVCGLVAGVAGVNIFKADRDPDSTSAMALAPAARPKKANSRRSPPTRAHSGPIAKNRPRSISGAIALRCSHATTLYTGHQRATANCCGCNWSPRRTGSPPIRAGISRRCRIGGDPSGFCKYSRCCICCGGHACSSSYDANTQ
jgi:hypothetical protein